MVDPEDENVFLVSHLRRTSFFHRVLFSTTGSLVNLSLKLNNYYVINVIYIYMLYI